MEPLAVKILEWLFLWFFVRYVFELLDRKRINYIEKYGIAAAYFFLVSVAIIAVFRDDLSFIPEYKFQITPFLFLCLLLVFNSLTYRYINKIFPNSKKVYELDDSYYFNKFSQKYLFSKSFEMLFQQTMAVLLAVWLVEEGLSFVEVMFVFALVFGLFGHAPLLFMNKKLTGAIFLLASVASSLVFPFLILKVEWGFIYSYICHWIFYIILGFAFILVAKTKSAIIK